MNAKRAVILGNPDKRPALTIKDYRHLKGTTLANTIASELADVLQLAGEDAHYDFEARIRIRPAEIPELTVSGTRVSFVDYEILLDDSVGERHEEMGVIKRPSHSERG